MSQQSWRQLGVLLLEDRVQGIGGPNARYENGDSAEYIANIILQALEEGEAEYFAHEHMRDLSAR